MKQSPGEHRQIVVTVARVHAAALAIVGALIGGLVIFLMTAWLIVKGGASVGAHLQLLAQYFPGYSVSWTGCLVGALYGMALGAVVAWAAAAVYNLIAGWRA